MISYVELGGTLFIPATHKDIDSVLNAKRYENLKSVLIDTEDSILQKDLPEALHSLQKTLKNFQKTDLLVFIRPRNPIILQEILGYEQIEKVDGFIFPKCGLDNVDSYFALVENRKFFVMPSIEGEELFDQQKLQKLRDKLLLYKEKIILVRFGLEDILRQLQMRRGCDESLFDLSVCNTVVGNFLALFKSVGFAVSGGVYPCFKDKEGFEKDIRRDLREGLFSKSIIHPNQIEPINDLYKVDEKEYLEARSIVDASSSVMALEGKMIEKVTMLPHARYILQRASSYGLRKY